MIKYLCLVRFPTLLVALALAACANQPQSLSGNAQVHVGEAAAEAGNLGLAEEMYAAAAAAAPADAAIQLRYADTLVRRGKIGRARALLQRGMNKVTDSRQLRDGLGSIYVLSGDSAHAIEQFDQSLGQDPNDLRALVNKAVALDLLRRHKEAQALYRRVLAATPDDATVINNLALSTLLAGEPNEAAAIAAPLRESNEMLPRVRDGIGVILAATGDLRGAHSMLGHADSDKQLLALARAATSRFHN